MVFSSAVFLFAFLPIVIILHTLLPGIRVKNALLIVASLIFYAWGEPVYILLLLLSILLNYVFGKFAGGRRWVLAIAVIVNLSMLIVYKYAGFLAETVNVLPFVDVPVPNIHMPIGISFFTFQAMSYVIDTYRRPDEKRAGFFDVMLYICLFPQLVAGPIVKYGQIKKQLVYRQVTVDGLYAGTKRFIIGLSKKMLIANTMAVAADRMFSLPGSSLDMAAAWVGAVSYTLQIYFDFSGYSDMALGMGKMFGFDFPENFNYPYIATSMRDFWKRWHISLTSWFREYLYFPLGGNRKGMARTVLNRFIVFVCTGIWHGANFTFLFWGIYHGLLTSIEAVVDNIRGNELSEKNSGGITFYIINIVKHVYTLLAIVIGFVIFRADTMAQAGCFVRAMFSFGATFEGTQAAASVMSPLFIYTAIAALFTSTPCLKACAQYKWAGKISAAAVVILYALCIFEISAGSYNPFIYFRF